MFWKTCRKFTGEHPCQGVISISCKSSLLNGMGCSPVNFLHIFRRPFPKNTFGGLLLKKVNEKISSEEKIWQRSTMDVQKFWGSYLRQRQSMFDTLWLLQNNSEHFRLFTQPIKILDVELQRTITFVLG